MDYKHKHLLLIVISAILIVALPFYIDLGWEAPFLIFVFYFLTKGIGSEVGAHRLWSHRSFCTSRLWERVIIVLNTLSGEGSILAFVGVHRLHHMYSDTDRDPHNPHTNLLGTIFYQHNTTEFNGRLVRDIISDPWLVFQHRHYFKIQAIIMLALALVSATALWYYAVNVWATLWTNFLVNVVCHSRGTKDNKLENTSTNNFWCDLWLLGAGLHNNHHAKPGDYDNSWGSYRFDIWGSIIRQIQTKNG